MTSTTEQTYDLDGIRQGLETDGIIACRGAFAMSCSELYQR